tara:strand:+ start:324 stop:2879 length:2556 start_codon:yes stop_codon:yes gene_type:complete
MTEYTLPEYVTKDNLEERLTENANWTFNKKYLDRNDDGEIIETAQERFYTIAKTMADVESQYEKSEKQIAEFTEEFYSMMSSLDFIPGGRVLTNSGRGISLFNCYVLDPEDSIDPDDDLHDVFGEVRKGARIHKEGGGTGYNFSKLRPRGSYVKKSKGIASGPVSFIGQFDKATDIINSGNRRGANMGILDVDHPDILDFIYSKAVRGELENFNVSVGATNKFMEAVVKEDYYSLQFNNKPLTKSEISNYQTNIEENKLGGSKVGEAPRPPSLILSEDETKLLDSYTNKEIGKINSKDEVQVYAPKLIDIISNLAWETADPGMIFLDTINKDNPLLKTKGPIKATNPCGEQPLHPYDACNLGSLNLGNMISNGKDGEYRVDWNKISDTTHSVIRFMDNVNDASKGPIKEIEETVLDHRRIGYGVMGWADMLQKLSIPYDSKKAIDLGEKVMTFISDESKKASVNLAKEKEVFPAFEGSTYDNGNLEDRVRNVQRTTIAPTGTIAMVAGVASGIEPYFSNVYYKNIRGGDRLLFANPLLEKALKKEGIYSEELMKSIEKKGGSVQDIEEIPKHIKKVFKVSSDLDVKDHVNIQAAFQKGTDNAVSKTINMPNSAKVEEVREAYVTAWQKGLKGITIYRDGSKDVQVLETIKEEEIKPNGYITPENIPDMMPSIKIKQRTPFGQMHANMTVDPDSGRPYEIFAQVGKGGDIAHADLEAICRLASISLRSNTSPWDIVEQLEGIGSTVSSGISREGEVTSLGDSVSRVLKKYMLAVEKYGVEDILTGKIDYNDLTEELNDEIKLGSKGVLTNGNSQTNEEQKNTYGIKCPECDEGKLIFQEGCKTCLTCDYSAC